MYVTTFYSFKGGVGRSMALVNVAVELAQRGHKVLAVDFDLEAPGLDTFDLQHPQEPLLGIVDYVEEYRHTNRVPSVEKFIYKSQNIGIKSGGLWVMPSGARLDSYAYSVANIDWGNLYEEENGFLLIEYLKEQWKNHINPDYVLIDSRTGHSDVGGICTRQLPDSVVLMFFPNAQNRLGLSQVVRDIRSEKTGSLEKDIRLHFIVSNVPDLDDEDRILEDNISLFKQDLEFTDSLIIHRYDSLSLLNQVVFTKDRPRSKLAREYRKITAEIIRYNPQDRDGVLDFFDRIDSSAPFSTSPESWKRDQDTIKRHIELVEETNWDDPDVLYRLGVHSDRHGNSREAAELFERAIDAGYKRPRVFLKLAQLRQGDLDDMEGAFEAASIVLDTPTASPVHILQALRILGSEKMMNAVARSRLSSKSPLEVFCIVEQLNRTKHEVKVALSLLHAVESNLSSKDKEDAVHFLVLSCIALGRFSEATEAIRQLVPETEKMKITQAFNHGMAMWGETRKLHRESFERVLQCYSANESTYTTPNNLQCMAITHWVVGKKSDAIEFAKKAKSKIRTRARQEFSCWRYLRVSGHQFEKDIDDILKLIKGDNSRTPIFMSSGTS